MFAFCLLILLLLSISREPSLCSWPSEPASVPQRRNAMGRGSADASTRRRVDVAWQAMQQLHPILAQTECEEAARPKAGHRNTPDPRHPKTSQDPRGVFFFACFIQKNTCLSCKLCGCYVDDVDVDGVDMCRSQVHWSQRFGPTLDVCPTSFHQPHCHRS